MGLTRPRAYQIYDIDYKQAVRVITLTNITLSGGAPSQVDSVNLSLNDRVLVAGQNTASQNGLYYVTTVGTGSNGTWARSIDGNETGEIQAGMIVMVTEGTIYHDSQWKLTTNDPIVIGSSALVFEQSSAYSFGTISVSGQANVVAETVGDVLTFAAGNNISLTTDAGSDTVTIAVTGISLNSISNGSSNVNVVSSGGNVTIGVGGTSDVAVFSSTGQNVTGYLTASGNITGSNLSGTLVTGTITTASQPNITSLGTLSSLTVTANVTGGNLITAGQAVITGNVTGGNLVTSGTTSTSSLTASTTINATGNITGGNVISSALVSGTTVTASGNVTGGNLVSSNRVEATGNVTGGNLVTSGTTSTSSLTASTTINATGNITGGNVNTAGQVVATGNISGGNLSIASDAVISGNLSVTGNATLSGNILGDRIQNGTTSFDIQTANGNANITIGGTSNVVVFSTTGANISGVLGVTGNITGGNLVTTGQISATGNITGGNIIGVGSSLTGINAFGTISVSGQSDVVADSTSDTLTLAAGTGIAITTTAGSDTITISSAATDSIFATGGDMGTIGETVTSSEDLGAITSAVTVEYDLGTETTSGIITPSLLLLPSYTVAGLSSVSASPAGQFVYCSNETGGAVPAFSDGTNWRRVTDRAIIS